MFDDGGALRRELIFIMMTTAFLILGQLNNQVEFVGTLAGDLKGERLIVTVKR